MKVQLVYTCTHCGHMVYDKMVDAEIANDHQVRTHEDAPPRIYHQCYVTEPALPEKKLKFYGICTLVGARTVPDSDAEAENNG